MNENEIMMITARMNDDDAQSMMRNAIRDANAYLMHCNFDSLSDDDADYIPAAADALAFICTAYMNAHEFDISMLTALRELLANDEFIDRTQTCDFATPLFDMIDSIDS